MHCRGGIRCKFLRWQISLVGSRIDALRPIQVEVLGRDSVPPDPQLLGPGITGASVCVTGAGGSIGSELCRQILSLKPGGWCCLRSVNPAFMRFIKLIGLLVPGVEVVPVLGSAANGAGRALLPGAARGECSCSCL